MHLALYDPLILLKWCLAIDEVTKCCDLVDDPFPDLFLIYSVHALNAALVET